ncbi:hypothetical protein HYT25_00930 [Candidatus Pacearchaeota archaeon]|nr:hypothetical protein [Candidatus Pacearchaeota archaeon]
MALYRFQDGTSYSVDENGIVKELSRGDARYKVLGFAEVADYKGGIPLIRNRPLFDERKNRNQYLMDKPKIGSKLIAMTINSDGKFFGSPTDKNTRISPPVNSFI